MFILSPELKKLTMEKRDIYIKGGAAKAVFRCVACAKLLTLDEKTEGNRCTECKKLLRK